jgi:hypothetical protein
MAGPTIAQAPEVPEIPEMRTGGQAAGTFPTVTPRHRAGPRRPSPLLPGPHPRRAAWTVPVVGTGQGGREG